MPRMDDEIFDKTGDEDSLIKQLVIADGKVGKSHWAAMAAAAGFNVLYMDGDVARPTIRSLPKEVRKNIYLMSVQDSLHDGARQAQMWQVIHEFIKERVFLWNDTHQKLASRSDSSTDVIWEIKPGRMDGGVIWVLDSWTSLTESMLLEAAEKNGIDLMDVKVDQMRGTWLASGQAATQTLITIRSARCHVIVLAHPDEYVKMKNPDGKTVGGIKEKDKEIEWTKGVPKSTSKPHGLTIPKYFTDVSWLELTKTGKRMMNFRPDPDRVGGGHFADLKDAESEYSFASLVKHIGGHVPGTPQPIDHWLRIGTAEEIFAKPTKAAQVLDGNQPTKSGGLASLMKKT